MQNLNLSGAGPDNTMGVYGAREPAQAHDVKAKDTLDVRDKVLQIMSAKYPSMQSLSSALLTPLFAKTPEMQDQITEFQQRFGNEIAMIQKHSWSELKDMFGDSMTVRLPGVEHSLEEFRNIANEFIAQLTAECAEELGLPTASWSAVGTVGYSSDVDVALNVQMDMGTSFIQDAAEYKTLRDCLHTYVFGGLSGVQLDTQSYIPHLAEINVFKFLYSDAARNNFQTGEKAAVILQAYVSLHKTPGLYQAAKESDINSISDAGERQAVRQLYTQVEAAMATLHAKVEITLLEQEGLDTKMAPRARKQACAEILQSHPERYLQAKEIAIVPIRMALGKRTAIIQQEIQEESKKLIALHGASDTTRVKSVQKELDSLHLELQSHLMLLAIMQDEGTISVAEGQSTILHEGGQIHAGTLRQRKSSATEFWEGKKDAADVLTQNPKIRQALNTPLATHLGATDGKSTEILRRYIGADVSETLQPAFDPLNPQARMIAAYEESMQLRHALHDAALHTEDHATIATTSSKYGLRIARNFVLALEAMSSNSPLPVGLQGLRTRALRYEKALSALEKCKRREFLNTEAATAMLTDVVLNEPGRAPIDPLRLKTTLQRTFARFDYGGEFFGKVTTKEEHLEYLKQMIIGMKDFGINVDNPQILMILQAHAGYNRLDPKYGYLNDIHDRAPSYTVEALKLTDKVSVVQFYDGLVSLGQDMRNMARDSGHLVTSTLNMVQMYNFPTILAAAINK